MGVEIFNEDCLSFLKRTPKKTFNLILQDPPYATTQNDWDKPIDFQSLWPEWERTAKDNAAIIFTAAQPFATDLINSNRKLFKYDLIWYKPLGTGHLNAKKMPMRNHELILVFYKKTPVYNPQMGVGIRKKGLRDNNRNGGCYGNFAKGSGIESFDDEGKRFPQSVIEITNGDRTIENEHPTQKPVDLMRYLITTYSNSGDLVFDGYSGSGTTAVAAYMEGRDAICCEIDAKHGYYQNSVNRLNTLKSQVSIFDVIREELA
jgi:site-specific DNA-methyltransferase (adenine-specific)